MQQESLSNEKDIKSIYNRAKKVNEKEMHEQSKRKSSYMQQESLRNEKDMKSTYNRKEKAFTCGENHFITRKRLNSYTRIIIWLHPVKSLSRGVGVGFQPIFIH